jgi:acyl-CoA thioesterase I
MTEMRICFVGDSITLGQGDTESLGWPGRLGLRAMKNGHDITCYNLGIRGDTSTDIAMRWRMECERRLPGGASCGIVFMFGINDMAVQDDEAERVPMTTSLGNATAILSNAVKRYRCLWIGPTPVRKSVALKAPHLGATYEFDRQRNADLNAAYRDLALKIQVPFLDLHSLTSGCREWRDVLEDGDGVHPTPAGHAYLANAVAQWLAWRDWLE